MIPRRLPSISRERTRRGPLARWMPTLLFTAAVLLAGASTLQAIHPQTWTHTSEADFAGGDFDGTVVTNLGDIELAMRSRPVAEDLAPSTAIFDVLMLDKTSALLAAGPEARLLHWNGQGATELLTLPGEQIFRMAMWNGKPLLAVSGPTPRLAVWDGSALHTLVALPTSFPADATAHPQSHAELQAADADAPQTQADMNAGESDAGQMDSEDGAKRLRYIWDILVDGPHIYLATGPGGRILRVDDPTADQPAVISLLETGQENVLCLARRGDGALFAGTDAEGLVLRIDNPTAQPDAIQSFVAYDAAEPEIGALLAASDGHVYFGTADASQARPGRLEGPTEEPDGRPAETDDLPADAAEPNSSDLPAEDASDVDLDAEALSAAASEPTPADAPDADQPQQPTAQQRDALRDVIRQRLLKARRGGTIKAGRSTASPPHAGRTTPSTRPRLRAASPDKPGEGNAVYRLDPEGFVSEVMRESIMILALIEHRPAPDAPLSLAVATGNEGQVYMVTPKTGKVTMLVDLDAQQVTTLLPDATAGGMVAATANPASLLTLDGRTAAQTTQGAYTSLPLDAGQIALWGMFQLTATTSAGADVVVRTRSGNLAEADDRFWSPWSEPIALTAPAADPLAPRIGEVTSPPARFLQYQLTLNGGPDTQPAATGPRVVQVAITRVVPNLPPKINSLTAAYSDKKDPDNKPQPQGTLSLEWEAVDPNEDTLTYTLEYRRADAESWLPLADDLSDPSYEWDTRRAPDGRYIIRLTASDAPDNPGPMARQAARNSEPVVIDNTPPQLDAPPAVSRTADGLTITAAFRDALLPIREVRYALDSTDDFKPLLADDLIYDSTRESVTVTIPDLSPGPHVVVLRATDAQGNALLHAIEVPGR